MNTRQGILRDDNKRQGDLAEQIITLIQQLEKVTAKAKNSKLTMAEQLSQSELDESNRLIVQIEYRIKPIMVDIWNTPPKKDEI